MTHYHYTFVNDYYSIEKDQQNNEKENKADFITKKLKPHIPIIVTGYRW